LTFTCRASVSAGSPSVAVELFHSDADPFADILMPTMPLQDLVATDLPVLDVSVSTPSSCASANSHCELTVALAGTDHSQDASLALGLEALPLTAFSQCTWSFGSALLSLSPSVADDAVEFPLPSQPGTAATSTIACRVQTARAPRVPLSSTVPALFSTLSAGLAAATVPYVSHVAPPARAVVSLTAQLSRPSGGTVHAYTYDAVWAMRLMRDWAAPAMEAAGAERGSPGVAGLRLLRKTTTDMLNVTFAAPLATGVNADEAAASIRAEAPTSLEAIVVPFYAKAVAADASWGTARASTNGVLDFDETAVDCGGSSLRAPRCATGRACVVDGDCIMGSCSAAERPNAPRAAGICTDNAASTRVVGVAALLALLALLAL
jgi:hypothetical protein